MTDGNIWTNSSPDEYENSCDSDDQQDIESFLYSLVHHASSLEDGNAQGHVEEVLHPEEENTSAPKRGWRYFNITPYKTRQESFTKSLDRLSEQYHCNIVRARGPTLGKNPIKRKPGSRPVFSDRFSALVNLRNRANMDSPSESNLKSDRTIANSSNPNCASSPEVVEIIDVDASEKDGNQVKHSTLSSTENLCPENAVCLPNNEDKTSQPPKNSKDKNISPSSQNKENSDNEATPSISQEHDDLNNTNPSLSSFDDCFEQPQMSFSKPKSKVPQNLNDCMTRVLGSMLDEDASRSSFESEKRPVQRPSKAGNGSSWTVGMSWEDMSSKFRFNFEVDSVCGDSVREGSISASSRANTPEPTVAVSPEPVSPDDVSKHDVSLKNKNCTTDRMAVEDDNSDSEVESVVEVTPPDKEPPLIVEISSDNEDIVPAKITKLDDDLDNIGEDIVIVYEAGTSSNRDQNNTVGSPLDKEDNETTSNTTMERSLISKSSKSTVVPAQSIVRQRKKARQRKVDPAISPGREIDDISTILAGMSNDPNLWRLCREDMYPRPSSRKQRPCYNCKQRDHFTWHCPEPVKIQVCSLCSEPGHMHHGCPERMCLTCGTPAPSFVRRCHLCAISNQVCSICKWRGHKSQQCPDLWRRYHNTIDSGPPIPPEDLRITPPAEMWCCNCARKGHYSHDCHMPSSPINEKILSHVVSYIDPTKGKKIESLDAPGKSCSSGPKSHAAKPTLVKKKASSPNSTPQSDAFPSPSVARQPNSPEARTRAAKSALLLANFHDNSAFKTNYQRFSRRLNELNVYPSQPDVLADYLESQLAMIQRPVLTGSRVQPIYLKLMALMRKETFTKTNLRQAYLYASQLNMTLLGYGGLAQGGSCVKRLHKHIKSLRRLKVKVPLKVRALINDDFKIIFKGCIRKDLNQLVNEYLKR